MKIGDRVRVQFGGYMRPEYKSGEIVRWWNAGDENRMAVVKMDGSGREQPFDVSRIIVMQPTDALESAEILAEDLAREHAE